MLARALNKDCVCATLNESALQRAFSSYRPGLLEDIQLTRPHLFSATSVFLSLKDLQTMERFSLTLEKAIQSEAYQKQALAHTSETGRKATKARGVFMGLDFHLSDEGPRLIEINTNAGGAFLNLLLSRAHISGCEQTNDRQLALAQLTDLEEHFYQMFLEEWKLHRGDQPLRTVAIIDQRPEEQYLYPEFLLFQELLSRRGLEVFILDPQYLQLTKDGLYHDSQRIDLIYNRLTDFYLEELQHQSLRHAYLNDQVVLTPNPHHHALYAHKANLVQLTDPHKLSEMGLTLEEQELIQNTIPKTLMVTAELEEQLWANKDAYFFKPVCGFGSRATYRGDKLTKRVWGEILQSSYVAQALVPPSKRSVKVGQEVSDLKNDIRAYTYGGQVQLLAARLYSGQTTNFRTSGGGFAPVFIV